MRDFEELEFDHFAEQEFEDGEFLENYEEMEDLEGLDEYEDMEEYEEMEDLEGLDEYEDLEEELDPELWEMGESDPFIGSALRKVRRALPGVLSNPLLKQLARKGAGALGQAIGGKQGGALASMLANQVLREGSMEGAFESDFEDESEFESEFESAGGDLEMLYEMQYYADRAANAESQDEADQFLPIIAGLASKLLPKAMPLIGRGIGALGRLFGGRKRTAPLLRMLPRVAARTATSLARQRATPRRVITTMSRQVSQNLANRRRAAAAMRRPMVGRSPLYGRRPMVGQRPMVGRRPMYRRRSLYGQRPGMRPRPGYVPGRTSMSQPGFVPRSPVASLPSYGPGPSFGRRPGYGRRPGSRGRRRILAPVYAVVRF